MANKDRKIVRPQGVIGITKFGKAELKWNPGFQQIYQSKIDNAQKFVDDRCIALMAPYTPNITGMLEKSLILGTKIGSGNLVQVAPQARYLYYGKLMVSSVTGSAYASKGETKVLAEPEKNLKYSKAEHSQAGPFWFERMKSDHKDEILKGAQQIVRRTK